MYEDDDAIIREASEWERAQVRLRQDRRQYVRKVIGWFCGTWVLFGVLFLSVIVAPAQCAERRDRKAGEEQAHAKAAKAARVEAQARREDRHLRQERAWEACLGALDLGQCDAVEARMAERCLSVGPKQTRGCLLTERAQ